MASNDAPPRATTAFADTVYLNVNKRGGEESEGDEREQRGKAGKAGKDAIPVLRQTDVESRSKREQKVDLVLWISPVARRSVSESLGGMWMSGG